MGGDSNHGQTGSSQRQAASSSQGQADIQLAIPRLLERLTNQQQPQQQNPEQILESLSSNISEFVYDQENGLTFQRWFSRYQDLFENDARQLDDAAKVRLLLRKLDTLSHSRYLNYILPALPKDIDFRETVSTLKKIFGSQVSKFRKRFQCLQIVKNDMDDIIDYGGKVNRACEDFEFQNLTLDHFKCLVFVSGLKSAKHADIRARLLTKMENETNEAPATLQSLIDEFQRLANLKEDTSMIEHQSSFKSSVHAVINTKSATSEFSEATQVTVLANCNRTGHKEGYCSCNNKSTANITSTVQHNDGKKRSRRKKRSSAETRGVFIINQVEHRASRRKFASVLVNGQPVSLQIDSASDISIISSKVWEQIGKPTMKPSSSQATNASGQPLTLLGEFNCEVTINGQTQQARCFVTSVSGLNLIGIEWLDLFDLWSIPFKSICNQIAIFSPERIDKEIKQMMVQHKQLFSGSLGHFNRSKVHLYLKPNPKPNLGIISPIEFSEWAAPIVVVKKPDGRVRICADYSTGLNDALEANHYPLPVPEEIFAQLAGSQVFSVIDLSDAYLQLEVTDESKNLLTINTHRGLFRFNRLAPGVKSAPGAFQSIIDGVVADIPGVRPFIDDVIIHGKSWEEHSKSLQLLLRKFEDCGFRLKIEKCKFFQTEIRYLGHIVDTKGIRPDPAKIKSIANIPAPKNVSELRSFLGAVNYYGKFVKQIDDLRHPMDQLLRKDVKWEWNSECQQSFDKFKQILNSNLLLTHYDPKLPIVVAADASKTGIGAVIFHKFPNGSLKAIQHASRSLSTAEQAYGQPEKEALALVYAVTKFHKMLLGRRFTLQTDHKPLLSIFGSKKGIPLHTANRLQRWALILLNYDFEIQYISTNEFGCADMLSRLIDSSIRPEEDYVIAAIALEEDMVSILQTSIDAVPVSFKALRDASSKCNTLKQVIRHINEGWPASSQLVSEPVKPFFQRRESLSVINGCVMFQERVVVPHTYRKRLLNQFHQGHPGVVRMKAVARSFVYWPGIDGEIEDFVKRCTHCAIAAKAPTKVKLESWPIPEKPWCRIHIDYAGPVDGVYFLVAVDSSSKWPEVIATKSTTASSTIKLLKQMFATFGIPETIVSDNGTQFTSFEFQTFCQQSGIEHIRTAPFHPQSNGLAERFVDSLKRSLKKIRSGGETLEDALRTFLTVYRSTPTEDGQSPAQRMMGRPMRTVSSLLLPPKPTRVRPSSVMNRQTETFNQKHGAISKQFKPGDTVYAQVHHKNSWSWKAGVVIERIGNVNYNVQLQESQRLIRSHANQLRTRLSEEVESKTESPLSIFLDGFGLQISQPPRPVPQADESVPEPEDGAEPHFNSSLLTDDESLKSDEGETKVPEEVPARPKRLLRLPSKLEGYWMF
ncbi:uncharacterized protein K02A2.6-like [Uranotaenia lowii]|uniref:uncharacterized protein K02A2.6-like n=1 Tax=Uranotaenia lowii TaxID=190385 RepID=UPI002479418E|nr:uncharacterized protein K02A2.6-like [Uranotaenia lowii]